MRLWREVGKDPEYRRGAPAAGLRLLVVEGNEVNRQVALGMLGNLGYRADKVRLVAHSIQGAARDGESASRVAGAVAQKMTG